RDAAELADDAGRDADGDGVVGDVLPDDGVRADHRAASDPHARADDDVLAEPGAVPDLHRADVRHTLVEHGAAQILERVRMVAEVDVPGEQHGPPEPDARDGRDHAGPGDVDAVADLDRDRVAALRKRLENAPRADEDIAADRDPVLVLEADRRLEDAAPP